MTGHLLGAAGAVEAISAVLAVQNDIIPPTINHFTDDPEIDPKLNFTFNNAVKRTVNVALNNTFGFGGHNVSLIFKNSIAKILIFLPIIKAYFSEDKFFVPIHKKYSRVLSREYFCL